MLPALGCLRPLASLGTTSSRVGGVQQLLQLILEADLQAVVPLEEEAAAITVSPTHHDTLPKAQQPAHTWHVRSGGSDASSSGRRAFFTASTPPSKVYKQRRLVGCVLCPPALLTSTSRPLVTRPAYCMQPITHLVAWTTCCCAIAAHTHIHTLGHSPPLLCIEDGGGSLCLHFPVLTSVLLPHCQVVPGPVFLRGVQGGGLPQLCAVVQAVTGDKAGGQHVRGGRAGGRIPDADRKVCRGAWPAGHLAWAPDLGTWQGVHPPCTAACYSLMPPPLPPPPAPPAGTRPR